MVKRGGTKRKIEIEKIPNEASRRVTCTKRRDGLFNKASQLCLLSSRSQIAVLSEPPSEDSYVSFHSFGHSSVDAVVSAFLSGNPPPPPPLLEDSKEMREDVGICLARKDLGLGFWWENESLVNSKNPEEIRDAVDSMKTLLRNIRDLRAEHAVNVLTVDNNDQEDPTTNGNVVLHRTNQDQTLIHQTSSAICCTPHVLPESSYEIPREPHQTLNLESITSEICCVPDNLLVTDNGLNANFNEITEEQDQISAICESFYVEDDNKDAPSLEDNLLDYIQETDIDQLIDFSSPFEPFFDNWVSENTSHGDQLCV